MNNNDIRSADVWWANLPPERKCGYHRWLDEHYSPSLGHPPTRGQFELPLTTDPAEEATPDDRNDRRHQ